MQRRRYSRRAADLFSSTYTNIHIYTYDQGPLTSVRTSGYREKLVYPGRYAKGVYCGFGLLCDTFAALRGSEERAKRSESCR